MDSNKPNYNLINILNKILEKKLHRHSKEINVAVGTVKRWNELKRSQNHIHLNCLN